jgi:putative DNA methylase
MNHKKKLIEVALPLEAINTQSAREKSIRHGLPATLHRWWARRPLAAARAVIWASLVDDPSSLPEQFPTEEEQNAERARLFKILEDLVKWENSNNPTVLDAAKAEIMKSTDGNPPPLLDPFAGGGAIPLEAQRLGLEAHASDLNPVAVMINKAMIEIPPKFAGQPPVNPDSKASIRDNWVGAQGLAEDVRYYGEWMKKKAFEKIGHLYPKVKDEHGQEHTVVSWIWARTIKCPNPSCGCNMPLVGSFLLSKRKGNEAYIQPIVEGTSIHYEVKYGKNAPESPKVARGAKFKCICCNEVVADNTIRESGKKDSIDYQLMAIVANGKKGRLYFSPNSTHEKVAKIKKPLDFPIGEMPTNPRWFSPPAFGLYEYHQLFTNRQLTALCTFSNLIVEVQNEIINYGGTKEYAESVSVFLAMLVNKLADSCNSLCPWEPVAQCPRQLFGRQAVPMVWDFAEGNPLGSSSGSWEIFINSLNGYFSGGAFDFSRLKLGFAEQNDAQSDSGRRGIMVSTDPPYYDNIGYADLSDFFYIWLRKSLMKSYPDIFRTMLVPKAEELVATPFRFGGSTKKARDFFEEGMQDAFKQIRTESCDSIPVTVFYGYKQKDNNEGEETEASTGWETMLSAIISSGFILTGTWPMRTEMTAALKSNVNALASSIVLVCRKRPADAPVCSRRDFVNALKKELKPALEKLQASNIAPVDLQQSALGPGMGVYSRYSQIVEADGTPMSVRSALQIINQELDAYFTEQDGDLDRDSSFCVWLYTHYEFGEIKFGDANTNANAKNTSIDKLKRLGILYAEKGVVRLLTRDEISDKIDDSSISWLLTQQLTHAMEKGGVQAVAKVIADLGMFGSGAERAKALAYRLFTIADRKHHAHEAFVYNSLVIAWSEIQEAVARIQAEKSNIEQLTFE